MHRTPRYRALGYDFSVSADDGALISYLETIFEQFACEGEAANRYTIDSVDEDGERRLRLRDEEGFAYEETRHWLIFAALVWHVNRRVIADSQDRLLVHASAAAHGDSTLIFPAAMEAGKTTLVAGLVRAGLQYVTDEAVAIDLDSGLVEPFPRSLSVDEGSWAVLADLRPDVPDEVQHYIRAQWQVPPGSIRSGAVAGTTRPRFVIAPQYVAGSTTRLEPLGRADAVRTMAEHSFNFKTHGGRGLQTLAAVVRQSTCHRLVVGDLDEACDLVFGLLGSTTGGEPVSLDVTPATVAQRHETTVTEELDGEAVVYDERHRVLHVLSPTATVIWQNLEGELSVADLAAALSEAFGAPLEVVRADTLTTVASFAELGLLVGSAGPAVAEAESDTVPATDDRSPPRFLEQPPHG